MTAAALGLEREATGRVGPREQPLALAVPDASRQLAAREQRPDRLDLAAAHGDDLARAGRRSCPIADDELDLVADARRLARAASSIVACSAEAAATRRAGSPSGAGIAASPLMAFLPASSTMRVGVGRLVTVASTVSAGGKSMW